MEPLSRHPVDAARLIAAVQSAERGGIAVFVGIVRDHQDDREVTHLEYSAYEPMAAAECRRIAMEAETRWPARVALQHRLGTLAIGDVAVVVAAASAHRAEAFEACRYVIEEVKRRVPVWKKEFYSDGTAVWVDPTRAEWRDGGMTEADPPTAVRPYVLEEHLRGTRA